MKRIALTVFAFVISAAIFAQSKKAEELVKFNELKFNFGKIKQGSPVNHQFEFTNVSSQPVVIETATASCGCTTPMLTRTPSAPAGR